MLALATEIEGHPDNVAAALEGGFVICDGARVHRIERADGLEAVLVVPARAGASPRRRAPRCPPTVPMADAVHNVAQRRRRWCSGWPRRTGS